jgi:hypothetical protein
LASEGAGGLIRERCDAELCQAHEHQTKPNPALAAVHGQAALLLRYDLPTYYVSRELLVAAVRTELQDDMVFESIPFPLDALVFMLSKGPVRHPTVGNCPFLVQRIEHEGATNRGLRDDDQNGFARA